ncbi:MAG: TolC family protein, partial [Proteobacteria bacterium]|nr:TolC family protein [Pseudomonadota bacterium]
MPRAIPTQFCAFFLTVLTAAGPVASQSERALSAEEAVRMALEGNPALQAAQNRLEAANAGVRGARAPFNPQAELAPGVGFTNGNSLLSQQIDIGGRRAASGKAATGLRSAAQAELDLARLQAAAGVRAAYFDLVRARAVEAAAAETATLAGQIRDAVRRRVE